MLYFYASFLRGFATEFCDRKIRDRGFWRPNSCPRTVARACFHCLDSISSYQIGQYQVLALNEILYLIQYWFLSCQVLLSETKIKIWHWFFILAAAITCSPPITKSSMNGMIAKKSTKFMGCLKNLHFLGEHTNLTRYSIRKKKTIAFSENKNSL